MKRSYWWVNVVEEICVEAPDGWTHEAIMEALRTETRWVADGESEPEGPSRAKTPYNCRTRITEDGKVEAVEPTEPPPEWAWFEIDGTLWATTGAGLWREGWAPKQPRGQWKSGADVDKALVPELLVPHLDVATYSNATHRHHGRECMVLSAGDYSVILDTELVTSLFPSEWRTSGPVSPVHALVDGEVVAVLMPRRP